jgi:hypothetical protein
MIRTIRIFLLVLISIGIGLLATQNLWVPNVVRAILAHETQPLVVSPTEPLTTASSTTASPGASNHCSATYGNPPAPAIWRTATTTNGVVLTLASNNVYANGKLIVQNIPASLGLAPATNVGLINFFDEYADAPSCDYYSEIALSPQGDQFALGYGRYLANAQSKTDGQNVSVAKLLVYNFKGQQLQNTTLTESYKGKSIPREISGGIISFLSEDEIAVNYFGGKEGEIGAPTVYFADGRIETLPYGALATAAVSPDGTKILFDDQTIPYQVCASTVSEGDMDATDLGNVAVFDTNTATSTALIPCSTTLGFYPVSWASDGSSALVLTTPDANTINGYFIYDPKKSTPQIATGSDAVQALKNLCASTYDCTNFLSEINRPQ